MNGLLPAQRVLAVALIALGLCSSAWAQKPPLPRDPFPEAMPLDQEMPPSPMPPSSMPPSSPSTHLEVPSGSDVKITIEVLSKPNAAPAAPAETEPPPSAAAPARPPARRRLPAIESIKPLPLPLIPDNPPPHEGAMFELPCVLEPPDLIRVEVLEALKGRPITGERLIRPDGMISLGFYGDLYVRGLTIAQVKEKVVLHLRKFLPDEVLGFMEQDEKGEWVDVDPKDTNNVFVDLGTNSSKKYFIQGDVKNPKTQPCTAADTVLEALNLGGGFLSTADPKNIRLVRPGRDGKPSRVYPVDYEAIRNRGAMEQNYQLFPGDRLIVGRNPLVTTTLEIDRFAAPMQTVLNMMLQHSSTMRSLTPAAPGSTPALTAAQREALVKEWADFWWKIAERPGGAALDEKTFREGLMKGLNPPRAKTKKPAKKK